MIKVVNKYETIFIINPNLGEEEITGLVEKFKSLIASAGEVENVDEWGKRRLAYTINDLNEGYYVLINFSAEPSFVQELERVYKITDGIVRAIVIKKDE
ncbi:MAG: small subunit ribosomal protein [Petroclostridium sp.]|jgi:small subunit ribosomal protein S6|uniref:30S ribosomal protein S6 n=1 Tax=Petroclostridium xylanilyticum TaxID=1792311 RepID=UPI000B97F93A|nr:30S ribosomal protein S6 [Petroclostridium xylanilyticum]MBZ4646729.1 ribosomal protein [Clostridia bacterium]MDK2811275.1 small subunit ribosomal protein [Petroclostridium sp.]